MRTLVTLTFLLVACNALAQDQRKIQVGELERDYLEYVPKGLDAEQPAPLVLLFHGGGGNASKAGHFGFEPLADQHGLLLAYPNAVDGHWNDGRGGESFKKHDAGIDDVAYALAVVRDMRRRHRVDPTRIYAVGASNGGMFVQRLGAEHAEIFAAVASWISSLPSPLAEDFAPPAPLSVLFMNGTEDPIVPYEGGKVVLNFFPGLRRKPKERGEVLGTDRTIALWLSRDGIEEEPVVKSLPDLDPKDGCKAELRRWRSKEGQLEVELYRIIGGGHTLPGGKQYLPVKVIGRTCGDFNAARATWRFLARHRRIKEMDGK